MIAATIQRHTNELETARQNVAQGRAAHLQRIGAEDLRGPDIRHWTQQAVRSQRLLQRNEIVRMLMPNQFLLADVCYSNTTRSVEIEDFAVAKVRQQEAVWCWAAGIQAVFKYGGINLNQEDIVENLKGKVVWETATGAEINSALNRTHFSPNPRNDWSSMCQYTNRFTDQPRLIFSLDFGRPMLAALDGRHVVIVHKASFHETLSSGSRLLTAVTLYDPETGQDIELASKNFTRISDLWFPVATAGPMRTF
jgi:hypothetical protein